ncbi:MAG: hypothetical protein VKL01_12705 [Limnothrix sp.]|nr:hypothetical protein [Limnothrix sp.]
MASPLVKRFSLALKRYLWILPVGPILGAGVGAGLSLLPVPPPRYSILGVLSYQRAGVSFSETGAAIVEQGQTLSPDILTAPDIIAPVAKEFRMDPELLLKSLRVRDPNSGDEKEKKKDSGPPTLEVRFTDEKGERGEKITNTLMKLMVEKSRQLNAARVKGIIDAIRARLPQVIGELRAAERNLERYDRVEGAAILAAQNGALIESIATIGNQQRQLQLQLEGVTAQVRSLEQRLGLSVDDAYVSSALSSDPMLAQLRVQLQQVEAERLLQSQRLRPEHPQMQLLMQRQQSLETLLNRRAQEVVGGSMAGAKPLAATSRIRSSSSLDPARQQLANSLVSLKTQQETLQRQLTLSLKAERELRQEYAGVPNKQLERDRLAQQVALKKALYDRMQAKLVDSEAAEAETVSSLTIAQPAAIRSEEIAQKLSMRLTLPAGFAGGLVLSGALLLVLGMLDRRYQADSEIRSALAERDIKLLGILPELAARAPGLLPVLVEPSPPGEAYEQFRSNLRRLDSSLKVLLMSSVDVGEGKSVVAYNLAIAAARSGKRTLLIELDLRAPSAAKALRVAPDPDAVREPFHYYSSLNNCARMVPEVENLYIAPSPGPQNDCAAILESSEIRQLLLDARSRFDYVIVEATTLNNANDALLLESQTDGLILVARPGHTDKTAFTQRLDELTDEETSTIRLIGVAIDSADSPFELLEEELLLEEDAEAIDPMAAVDEWSIVRPSSNSVAARSKQR